jgi:hypothetical protein
MSGDNRDVLETLESELCFLENGGYSASPRTHGRSQFILEDSPTCMNYGSMQRLLPCSECFWMRFVPQDCSGERIPCRHIPLNVEGFTIDTYYRLGTQEELEAAWAAWLRRTIQRDERQATQKQGEPPGLAIWLQQHVDSSRDWRSPKKPSKCCLHNHNDCEHQNRCPNSPLGPGPRLQGSQNGKVIA